jgi:hypothetical protein
LFDDFDIFDRPIGRYPETVKPLDLPDEPIKVEPLSLPDEPIKVGPLTLSESPVKELTVGPLSLPESPKPIPSTPKEIEVMAIGEHPDVRKAFKRGLELLPDFMKDSGHIVRNHLNKVLPLTFEKITSYGEDVLTHAANLVSEVKKYEESIHEIHAEDTIKRMLHDADPANHQTGLKALISGAHSFDLPAAQRQLSAMETALQAKLLAIDSKIKELEDSSESLKMHVATSSILQDIYNSTEDGSLTSRKGSFFNVSLQEVDIALKQVKTLQQLARETIMRCKEVRLNVLPSYGIR